MQGREGFGYDALLNVYELSVSFIRRTQFTKDHKPKSSKAELDPAKTD